MTDCALYAFDAGDREQTILALMTICDAETREIAIAMLDDYPDAPAEWGGYRRARQLRNLLPLTVEQQLDLSLDTTAAIVRALGERLVAVRNAGRAGHWSYNHNRHAALVEAMKAETAYLNRLLAGNREREVA